MFTCPQYVSIIHIHHLHNILSSVFVVELYREWSPPMQPELIVHKVDINGDVAVKCSNSLHICGDCGRYVTPVFEEFFHIFQDFFREII